MVYEKATTSQETHTLDQLSLRAQVNLVGAASGIHGGTIGLPSDNEGFPGLLNSSSGLGEDLRVPDVALFSLDGAARAEEAARASKARAVVNFVTRVRESHRYVELGRLVKCIRGRT
jgi:hypothetical protein